MIGDKRSLDPNLVMLHTSSGPFFTADGMVVALYVIPSLLTDFSHGCTYAHIAMHNRHRPVTTLYQASMIWAEDAIRQFGCRVLVAHLFLIFPDPDTVYMCLLASGEACSTVAYCEQGLLETAPGLKPLEGGNIPIALLRASDWANLPPIALSPEPQFPSLHALLSSLLGTWLQQPFSAFSSHLAVWITSVYEVRDDPALVGPTEGGALGPYLRASSTSPTAR